MQVSHVTEDCLTCPVCWGTVLLKEELARHLTYGGQQLLYQQHVTIVGLIVTDTRIDKHKSGVAQFSHANCFDNLFLSESEQFLNTDISHGSVDTHFKVWWDI